MDLERKVLEFPIAEQVLEVMEEDEYRQYVGKVVLRRMVLPLNSYSMPIPGSDDELAFGIFGDVAARVLLVYTRLRKILTLQAMIPGVQISYYDYNERSKERVRVRFNEKCIGYLENKIVHDYQNIIDDNPIFRDLALEQVNLHGLLRRMESRVKEITQEYLGF